MKKKKILLLSDDMRIPSGVGTMSKALIEGTLHKYDWAQIGGAIKHPDEGKVFDVSKDMEKQFNIKDAYCKVYPVTGYGNENILRQVSEIEKPDAIMHFTDPRFWGWLYAMEHEIRQQMPLMYLNIWDDLPYPHWNENAYESCDLLMAISKQTYNINKNVCARKPRKEHIDLTYVPHGIKEDLYHPIDETVNEYIKFKSEITANKTFDYIIMFNSRNIHRKHPSDLMIAYKNFCDSLPKEKADRCLLIFHTDPVDTNGTDLPAVSNALCKGYNIAYSAQKVTPQQLNYMYNLADVVCNPSSAEGFGLSHMESMMAGTPTIASVIGGLQDQMGFTVGCKDGDRDITINDFTADIPSNSTGLISKQHGEWTYPLWPQINLQGSPATPYIYDSRVSVSQITDGLKYWYDMGREERKIKGKIGRAWAIKNGFTAKAMCDGYIKSIDKCFETWKPRQKYTLLSTGPQKLKRNIGALV